MTSVDQPHVLVLFGATGDLAQRKIFPALYRLHAAGRMPQEYAVIGSGRHSPGRDEEFRADVRAGLMESLDEVEENLLDQLVGRVSFQVSSADDGSDLAKAVSAAESDLGGEARRLVYLSVPPSAMEDMIAMLGREGLADRAHLVVEKPFGLDLESSRSLDAALKAVVEEEQTFRIDHFLGKEAVQNILALRFANRLLEPLWSREHIESVQIDVPETIGMEGRGAFYEDTGCLRDMISTHLCQVLGFVAMEEPTRLDAPGLRDAKATVFTDLQPLSPERTVFGQYVGYRDEDDVADDSAVETLVALEARVDNERWRGVPFYLRTGKAMAQTRRTVTIRLKRPGHDLFDEGQAGVVPNQIVLELTDEPVITLRLNAKRLGPEIRLETTTMCLELDSEESDGESLQAYERLLLDALVGDQTLFTRADEVDRLWQVCAPVLADPPSVRPYEPGSWGPWEAVELAAGGWELG